MIKKTLRFIAWLWISFWGLSLFVAILGQFDSAENTSDGEPLGWGGVLFSLFMTILPAYFLFKSRKTKNEAEIMFSFRKTCEEVLADDVVTQREVELLLVFMRNSHELKSNKRTIAIYKFLEEALNDGVFDKIEAYEVKLCLVSFVILKP